MGFNSKEFKSVKVLFLEGHLYTKISDEFYQFFKKELNSKSGKVGMNFSKLEYIDSAGVGCLVRCLQTAMNSNKELFIYSLNPQVKDILFIIRG